MITCEQLQWNGVGRIHIAVGWNMNGNESSETGLYLLFQKVHLIRDDERGGEDIKPFLRGKRKKIP